jgi:hypothetical protein
MQHTSGNNNIIATIEERFNICYGEIAVICGPDIRQDTCEAYRRSLALLGSGEFAKALVITAGCTSRRALAWAREVDPERIGEQPTKNDVVVYPCIGGKLCKEITAIEAMIERHGFDILMINSWEFTSMHPRYRDELLFALQRLTEEHALTVVIFSHANGSPNEVGRIQRGTLGKLSVIAAKIVSMEVEAIDEEQRTYSTERRISRAAEVRPARSERFVGSDGSVDLTELHEPLDPATLREAVAEEEELLQVA